MGNPVVANVIKSGAILWYAPVGEAIPDETTIDFGTAWGGNWAKVGYTKTPLTFAYTSEEFDVEVEEELPPARRFRVKENLTLETVLAELIGAYLELSAGGQGTNVITAAGAGQDAYEEWTAGGIVELDEKQWGFEGMYLDSNGAEFPIRFFVWKGTAMINGALEFSQKSTDYTGIPIQIKALVDASKSAGQKLFKFQRVTAEKTS